ncbi:cell wall mannoprotein 1 family protein [Aspergillus ibericus CBS 121593]|uniref:Cell wall protein n=1 Tax=Aspergillus ibericus CBS 121593 TaxID=1448316 RepID=A0A395GPV8_9EURO|nr:hypothetical protein BO80DRAFT_483438 [Aspergillus ibericus CBS 121593]RAK96978.1 hypothetical protein BO80DRAFT_483438 [Aspergillus ibericus CBS 121593]
MPPLTTYLTLIALTALTSTTWIPLPFLSLITTSTLTTAYPTTTSPSTSLDAILTSITTLATDYTTLNTAINHFNGTQTQYFQILACELTVETSIQHVIAVTTTSTPLDTHQSQQVLEALKLPYPGFMRDVLGDVADKAECFAEVGRTEDVIAVLRTLKELSDELVEAVQGKVVERVAEEVGSGKVWVDGLFEETIRWMSMSMS